VSGLPVIGLIPRLKNNNGMAIIGERQVRPVPKLPAALLPPTPTPSAVPGPRTGYTFFENVSGAEEGEAGPTFGPPASAVPSKPTWKELHFTMPPPGTLAAEAYSILHTNVAFAQRDAPLRTLVFTSPLPGDGKTTTAFNFALAVAQRGLKVLLVDADLRRGVLHKLIEGPQAPGLSEVLRGAASLEDACRSVVVPDGSILHVLPSGRLPASPSGMMDSPQLRAFLASARDEYDLVLFDAPPVNLLTDAALLGLSTDGIIVVVRTGVTDSGALAYAVEQLSHVGATILGVVLNDIDFRKDGRYDGAYRYYAYDSYSNASSSESR
jgi:capsular exopolysaccharide synthesis family protein